MRIAITSNAPWTPTGYGMQTAEISPLLKGDGHQVAIMANYGLAGSTMDWNGIPVFGQGHEAYSNDLTPSQIRYWLDTGNGSKGFGLSLYDVWVYKSPEWDLFPMAAWVPIDHKNAPVEVVEWLKRTDKRWSIAMSRFGERELISAGIKSDSLFYAPHSVSNVFVPTESSIREEMGVPKDAHLTIIVGSNKGVFPIRKCFPEMISAWSKFAENKNDAYLLLWTEVSGVSHGFQVIRFLDEIGVSKEKVKIVPQLHYRNGIDHSILAKAYSASDVLLMTSRGEGFGIPAIEAQACGTPVILTDWTAQTELCGSGWLVDGQPEWDEMQTGWWKVPNVDEIVNALESSYKSKGNLDEAKQMSQKALDFAKEYKTDIVYNKYWKPIISKIESDLK